MKPIAAPLAIALCNMVAMRSSKVLLPLFAIDLGTPVAVIGMLVASISLLPLFLSIYAGRVSDRMGIRLPMLAGGAGVALAMAVPYFAPSLWGLFASAILLGTANIFYAVSMQHWIGLLGVTPEARTRNYGTYSMAVSAGAFLGPMVAGFGIDRVGYAHAYLICMLFPLAGFLANLFAGSPRPGAQARPEGKAAGTVTDLLRVPELRRILITGGILLTGIDLFEFYMPVYTRGIGLSASVIGVIVSMYSVAAFLVRAAIPILVRWKGEEQLLTRCLAFGALAYLAVPFLENPWLLGGVAAILGLCMGCGQPLTISIIYDRSPAGRTGEALGIRLTANNITHIGVPAAFGAMGAALGVSPVFWIVAALLGAGALYGSSARDGAAGGAPRAGE
ncbi:MAG: MFS transporter [Burkholderiales bacterium]|nr:MFS transporter [Burkholderiales bacterium]